MVADDDATLTPFADGIWLGSEPVRFLGLRLTSTMTVLRLADGSLLLYSPVAMTPARRAAVEALGSVAHLYAPNMFHHRWISELGRRVSRGAPARAPRPGQEAPRPAHRPRPRRSGAARARVCRVVEELRIDGFRLQESVLVHAPSGTLVVADLVHNIGQPAHRWTRMYTRTMGFYDRIAVSRAIRWTAFADRAAARRSVDTLLARPFDRLVVGHGAPVAAGGRDALAAAYAWLPPPRH